MCLCLCIHGANMFARGFWQLGVSYVMLEVEGRSLSPGLCDVAVEGRCLSTGLCDVAV